MNGLMIIACMIIVISAGILLLLFVESVKRNIRIAKVKGEGLEKIIKTLCRRLLIIGLCLFAIAFIYTHLPRGFDSILSQNIDGAHAGDDSVEVRQGTGQSNTTYKSVESMGVYTVVVEGKRIYFDEQYFDEPQEFAAYLDTINDTVEIRIKDDYAVASAFHNVEKILEEKKLAYVLYDEAKVKE